MPIKGRYTILAHWKQVSSKYLTCSVTKTDFEKVLFRVRVVLITILIFISVHRMVLLALVRRLLFFFFPLICNFDRALAMYAEISC